LSTNQFGFSSPENKQPVLIPAGFTFGLEKLPIGGTTGWGLAPTESGKGTGKLLQIF
jgi:hypothetical protein